MWPWSTISRLKTELDKVRRDQDFWRGQTKMRESALAARDIYVGTLEEGLRTRYAEIEDLKALLDRRGTELDDLRARWTTLNENYESAVQNYDRVCLKFLNERRTSNELRVQLEAASKNDQRDPKTGRFMKAVG